MKIKHYDKFMNEEAPGDFVYTTTLTRQEVNLSNVEKGDDDDIDIGNTIIDWELDLDQRKAGINSFGVMIKRVRGSYTINGAVADFKDGDRDFDTKGDEKWHMEAEYNGDFEFGGSLYPNSAEIDLAAKKITVAF